MNLHRKREEAMSKSLEAIINSTDPAEEANETNEGGKTSDTGGASEGERTEDTKTEDGSDSGESGTDGTSDSSGDSDSSSDGGSTEDAGTDTAEDGGATSSDDSSPDISKELKSLKDNQDELKQILRVTRRENATLRAKLSRIDKSLAIDDELDEDEGGDKAKPELSNLEALQVQLAAIGQKRGAQLELMAEQMAEMNKYSDLYDVCSKQNVGEIVEAAAKVIIQEHGGDIDEVMLELEVDAWNRPNPYKYLYTLIKEHHPKYVKSADATDSKSKMDKVLGTKTASSIQDMGTSGGGNKGGWTADKIDKLPEDELTKVPGEVYEKYLAGELD
jgi:hypothetical protein